MSMWGWPVAVVGWRLVVLAVLASACGLADAGSFEEECKAKLKTTTIRVLLDEPRVDFDYSKSTAELTGMQGTQKGMTLGLTQVRNEMAIRSTSSSLVNSDGRACIRAGFDVIIKLNPQKVFVGNEFKEGTCAFKEIKNHEMRHVNTNQGHAQKVAKAYETKMRAAFGQSIYYGSASGVQRGIEKAVRDDWLPNLAGEIKKSRLLHEKIDSPQEYARMGSICNGEIGKTLGRFK